MSFGWGRKKSQHKYGAKTANGFGSKLESAVNDILLLRERAGELSDIKRQQTIVLQSGPREVRISWRMDFTYLEAKTGELICVEAKGFETPEYKLKLKMWRKNPPHTLEIWKGTYTRPVMVERIVKAEAA